MAANTYILNLSKLTVQHLVKTTRTSPASTLQVSARSLGLSLDYHKDIFCTGNILVKTLLVKTRWTTTQFSCEVQVLKLLQERHTTCSSSRSRKLVIQYVIYIQNMSKGPLERKIQLVTSYNSVHIIYDYIIDI